MKKILSVIMAGVMAVSLCGCFGGYESDSESGKKQEQVQKVYGVGDTQTIDGVEMTVTKVESGKYYGKRESTKGKWVCVYFSLEDKNDEYDCFYPHNFTLNDTYTVREYSYRHSELGGGLNTLNNGTVYEMWLVFDCSYGHEEKDMVFTYDEGGLFGKELKWVL